MNGLRRRPSRHWQKRLIWWATSGIWTASRFELTNDVSGRTIRWRRNAHGMPFLSRRLADACVSFRQGIQVFSQWQLPYWSQLMKGPRHGVLSISGLFPGYQRCKRLLREWALL